MSSLPVSSGPSALPAAVSAPLLPEGPVTPSALPPTTPSSEHSTAQMPRAPGPTRAAQAAQASTAEPSGLPPSPAPSPPRPTTSPISQPTPVVTWAPRPARTAGPTTGPMSLAVPAAVPASPPSAPPGGDDRLALRTRCRLRAEPASVPEARRFVGDALINASERGISSLDVALLLTSELTSFVIRRGAADSFAVDVAASVNTFLVVVTEQTPPWMLPGTMETEANRQLRMVGDLAESWGITATPGSGESVWFRLAL